MKRKFLLAVACCSVAASLMANPGTHQTALSDAARYTVDVFRFSKVGLNAEDGQSSSGTGFLFDRANGWILYQMLAAL